MPCSEVFILKRLIIALSISAALFCTACEPPQAPPPVANTQPVVNAASPSPQPVQPLADITVTLPVLDALLADEAFVNEAKASAQLSDEEVQKLRDAARNEVLKLTDDPSEDDGRSARAAIAGARRQVQEILGPGKADMFLALAQRRWASGGQQLQIEPNQIPTDTRVVVNAPAYRMDVFRDGQLIKSYKVGIGYPEFPLPVGLRKIEEIIFNPTWTPPDEPWVRGKVQPGKKVEAGSKLNPLGPIKIPIGLPSLIHGGKSPDRLGTFASHGCVGLTSAQVQDFAMQISALGGWPMSMQDIKAYEADRTETKEAQLPSEIPVELRYETIVLENGVLKIYRDVYEKGTNTEENLNRVLGRFGLSLDQLTQADRDKVLEGLETMAAGASGRPIPTDAEADRNRDPESKSAKVTRNIKGKKEFVFAFPNAAGKGYPAPIAAKN